MKTVKPEELSVAQFQPFGAYANLVDPDAEKLGAPPVEFFRDMVQQNSGGTAAVSYSTCRVEKRKMIIDTSEYHSSACEGILPLDNDVLIHVAPSVPSDEVPVDRIRAFLVPRGTMAVLRPGVWHHAPFTVNDKPANVLIVLPERTYANDSVTVQHTDADKVQINA